MSNNLIYNPNESKKIFSRIYAGVFFSLLIALITIIFTLIRTDIVTNSVLKKENLPFLLIVSDENGPVMTEVVLFNAQTDRLALIDIPYEAGDLLPNLKRSDRYSVFYQQGDKESYRHSIEELLNINFLFTLELNVTQLVKLVDLLEGIDLYFFAPIDRINPITQKRYIYNAGEQHLDGDQSRDFLYAVAGTSDYTEFLQQQEILGESFEGTDPEPLYTGYLPSQYVARRGANLTRTQIDTEMESRSILRQKNLRYTRELLLGIASTLQKYSGEREKYINLLYNYFQTDLNKRSFRKLLFYLSKVDTKSAEVIFQDFLGEERMVQGKRINFPIYDGQVIRSQVVRISTQLRNNEEIVAELYPVRVEILNGTNVNGLASRTGALYSREGFDVINVDNADRSDYDKTVVVNLHSKNLDDVRRVAQLVGAENVILQPLPGGEQSEAEVRVVLGKDFDEDRITE